MRTLALKDGDIYTVAGQLALVTGDDQTVQNVSTRLKSFMGEYFYNKNYGVPYWQTIQNQDNVDALNMAIKRIIEGTDGIVDILKFNSDLDQTNRIYTINFTATTVTGQTVSNLSQSYEF